jgi:GNAT superfamily N-acetyltransferase
MTITSATAADHAVCLEIAQGLPEYFNASGIAAMAADLAAHDLLIARDDSRVLGFLTTCGRSPGVAELTWLAVRRGETGKGIGSALLAALEARLDHVRLLVVKTLAESAGYAPYVATRRFYARHGFLQVAVIDPYPEWDPGNPCAILVKALA